MKNATAQQPNVTMQQNADAMAALQKQMEDARKAMAEFTAKETKLVLDRAMEKGHSSKLMVDLPTPTSHYLTGRMASALFMALRDELVTAYMRNESVQADKAILLTRKEEGSFRSDVEAATAERSLAYYENLEERLEEIEALIADTVRCYDLAVEAQRIEDDNRQSDVAPSERSYVNIPALRWVSNAEKQQEGWEARSDIERMARQADFFLLYNQNRGNN